MSERAYIHVWPITDRTLTNRQLRNRALPDLDRELARIGLRRDGRGEWDRTTTRLTVVIPVASLPLLSGTFRNDPDRAPWLSNELRYEAEAA